MKVTQSPNAMSRNRFVAAAKMRSSRSGSPDQIAGTVQRAWLVLAVTAAALVSYACGGGAGAGHTTEGNDPASRPVVASAPQTITVFPSASALQVGQIQQYTSVVKDKSGNILSGVNTAWSSSDPAVATIDRNGLAQGVATGTAGITASTSGIKSQLASVLVSGAPAPSLTALPPWLTYCDIEPCSSAEPVVVASCPADQPMCNPARRTFIVARVDEKPISGVFLTLTPVDAAVRLVSGNGIAQGYGVSDFFAPNVTFGSDQDVVFSYYHVVPVWGGTTSVSFNSTSLSSAAVDTIFYRHPSYDTGNAAADLHAKAQAVISAHQTMTGVTPEHVTAFFMPTEMAVAPGGEGNFSYGNGTVTVNYGNPPYIAALGGIINTAVPRFAHEYTHELFNEIAGAYQGNPSCLNEGIADAVAYASGFLPEPEFGPVGLRGTDFDASCVPLSESHDVGNCYFWHVKKAGLLNAQFLRGIFHPKRTYEFDSCQQNTVHTGNNVLVLFTEAAGGADMLAVLDSMHIPHAASYAAAKQALGLR